MLSATVLQFNGGKNVHFHDSSAVGVMASALIRANWHFSSPPGYGPSTPPLKPQLRCHKMRLDPLGRVYTNHTFYWCNLTLGWQVSCFWMCSGGTVNLLASITDKRSVRLLLAEASPITQPWPNPHGLGEVECFNYSQHTIPPAVKVLLHSFDSTESSPNRYGAVLCHKWLAASAKSF